MTDTPSGPDEKLAERVRRKISRRSKGGKTAGRNAHNAMLAVQEYEQDTDIINNEAPELTRPDNIHHLRTGPARQPATDAPVSLLPVLPPGAAA